VSESVDGGAVTPEAKLTLCYALISVLMGAVAFFLKKIVDSVGEMARTVVMLVTKVENHVEAIGELRARSLMSEKERGEHGEKLTEMAARLTLLEQRVHDVAQHRRDGR
jgi:Mg2+ and Co2+ transporter CorA